MKKIVVVIAVLMLAVAAVPVLAMAAAATVLTDGSGLGSGGGNGGAPGDGGGDGGVVSGGSLNTAKVPAKYVAWVEQAGTRCAAASAPLIAAQITQESGWNPNAVSDTGAEGIAQFEPGTWETWGVSADGIEPPSPFDAHDGIASMANFDCGLAKTVAKVPGNLVSNMLAAYNAGAGAVLKYQGVPPYAQTEGYVKNIEAMIPRYTA